MTPPPDFEGSRGGQGATREAALGGTRGGLGAGLAGIVQSLRSAASWVRAVTAFVAGALSVLAMAPFFLSPVLFLTLPTLVFLIDTADRPWQSHAASEAADRGGIDSDAIGRAGVAGWFFGLGYFMFGLFWVGEAFLVEAEKFAWLLPAAVTMLPAGLALFFAAATAAARAFWRPGFYRVVMLALLVSIAEWLRGHVLTGLPWNTLGYALTAPDVLMQTSGLFGIYGLTLITVVVFAAPLVSLADAGGSGETGRPMARALRGTALSVLLLAGLTGYGFWRLSGATAETVPGVLFRIVQPSIVQRDKWQREKQREIFDLHLALTRDGGAAGTEGLAEVTHVVWPEAAMPFLPLDTPQALKEIGDVLPDGVHLITGALRVERSAATAGNADLPRDQSPQGAATAEGRAPGGRPPAYNSLMAFGPSGGLVAVYDKIHLVPFGEYLPLQAVLESVGLEQLTRLRGGFAKGRTPRPLIDVPGLPPVLGLVCYEAIFPAAVVQGQERPGVIVNVTNDGWFGNTTGPRQHLQMTRVRAVEEGLPVIRAANNGISAVIDGYGRISGQLDLDVRGVLDRRLPISASQPLYGRYGDAMFLIICFLSVAGNYVGWRRDSAVQ